MYCRECGEQILNEKAVICVKCGTSKGMGNNFCPDCGVEVKSKNSQVCLSCGISLKKGGGSIKASSSGIVGEKSKVAAGLLAFFLGGFGVHRFYLGYKQIGFIQLGLTLGGLLFGSVVDEIFFFAYFAVHIWAIVDTIMIFMGKIDTEAGERLA